MASNPYVNKVQFGNTTVMDISDTTATESDVISGKDFYKANGAKATGSAVMPDISNCYQTTDTAETTIDDADYFPFYDSSASGKRKSLWSNIKSVLKTYFDGIYQSKLTLPLSTSNGGTGNATGYVTAGQKANTTLGTAATAEGTLSTASGNYSHAEGYSNTASGTASHAQGMYCTAEGNYSNAQGYNSHATANYTNAIGLYVTAGHTNQVVTGHFNNNQTDTIFEVGNGHGGSTPEYKNAIEVYTDRTNINGDLYHNGSEVSFYDMIPTQSDITTIKNLSDGTDNYVVNAYTAKRWSNFLSYTLYSLIPANTDTIGVWNDDWKSTSVRTGWIWHSALHGILSDNLVEIEPIFDCGHDEVVSLYAYRIDDDVTYNNTPGGAIAIKLNGKTKTNNLMIGIRLKWQRTELIECSRIS